MEDITEKNSLPVRQYITAGREDEQVPDKSIFKRSFLVGLEGDADMTGDGYITGSELGMYLSVKVVNYTHGRQHPQYGKINNPNLDRGDFIFVPLKRRQIAGSDSKIQKTGEKTSKPNVVVAERTKQNTNLEMLFWQSIKDLNDCEMFAEYLRKFPEGNFSGLARIYRKRLECDDFFQGKATGAIKDDAQASASLGPKDKLESISEQSLAIFPWHLAGVSENHKNMMIEVLAEIFGSQYNVKTFYSHYELGKSVETQSISEKILSDEIIDNLWISKGFLSVQPNLNLICEFGNELYLDKVLIFKFLREAWYGAKVTIYLIDVKAGELYQQTWQVSGNDRIGPLKLEVEEFLEKFLFL